MDTHLQKKTPIYGNPNEAGPNENAVSVKNSDMTNGIKSGALGVGLYDWVI